MSQLAEIIVEPFKEILKGGTNKLFQELDKCSPVLMGLIGFLFLSLGLLGINLKKLSLATLYAFLIPSFILAVLEVSKGGESKGSVNSGSVNSGSVNSGSVNSGSVNSGNGIVNGNSNGGNGGNSITSANSTLDAAFDADWVNLNVGFNAGGSFGGFSARAGNVADSVDNAASASDVLNKGLNISLDVPNALNTLNALNTPNVNTTPPLNPNTHSGFPFLYSSSLVFLFSFLISFLVPFYSLIGEILAVVLYSGTILLFSKSYDHRLLTYLFLFIFPHVMLAFIYLPYKRFLYALIFSIISSFVLISAFVDQIGVREQVDMAVVIDKVSNLDYSVNMYPFLVVLVFFLLAQYLVRSITVRNIKGVMPGK